MTQRLNKQMAELGLCSRREADDWIARGWVRVCASAGMGVSAKSPRPRARRVMAEQLFISAYILGFSDTYPVGKFGPLGPAVKPLRGYLLRKPTCRRHVLLETVAIIPCGGVFGLVMIWWWN